MLLLLLLQRAADQRVDDAGTVRGAGARIQRLGQAVDERDGPPVRGPVHGVDAIRHEEPFAQLEVVRRHRQQGVEEFGRLQHAGGTVGVLRGGALGRVQGTEGVVELGVDDGPEGSQVHGRGFEYEGPEDHVDLRSGDGGGRRGRRGAHQVDEFLLDAAQVDDERVGVGGQQQGGYAAEVELRLPVCFQPG